jgi:RND family efflux transporter MFP subunit
MSVRRTLLRLLVGTWGLIAAATLCAQSSSPALNVPASGAQRSAPQSLPSSGSGARPDWPQTPVRKPAPETPGEAAVSVTAPPAASAAPMAGRTPTSGSGASVAGLPTQGPMPTSGVTQASRDLKLSVTAAGRVEGLFVKEGDRVRKGDLMMHMDRALEALEVKRREVMLQDRARLEELMLRERTLAEQVRAARSLLPSGGVSRKQVEDEELALGAIVAERKSIEFAKQRERVELDLAREAYERRHLRSPIDGIVTRIYSRIGESVAPHEPVMVVVDVRTVRFTGTVPIVDSGRLRVGSPVQLQLGEGTDAALRQAQVVFVSPVADPASGLVEVIAEFDNSDGSIRPGIAGRVMAQTTARAVSGKTGQP